MFYGANAKLGISTLLIVYLKVKSNYMTGIGYGYTKPEVIHIANYYAISVWKEDRI